MNPLVIDNFTDEIVNGQELITLFSSWINDKASFCAYLDMYTSASELYLSLKAGEEEKIIAGYLRWKLELMREETDLILCDVQPIF